MQFQKRKSVCWNKAKAQGEEKMSKPSKECEYRMQGMIYALNIAKKDGVDALESDIRKRGFTRAPLKFSQKDIDEFIEFMSKNLYVTSQTVWFMALNTTFGFGKKRLNRLKESFDKLTREVMDFDYLGNHYATLEDYAVYLNGQYGMGIDVERAEMCQESSTADRTQKRMANVDELIRVLKENGFGSAAEFIEKKI